MTVTPELAEKRIKFDIKNLAGHALPSGATAERQMWIEMIVQNEQGEVVFETGTLDAQGDLRDPYPKHTLMPGSDPQLILWNQEILKNPTLADPNSTAEIKLVTFPWQGNDINNHLIPADGTDTEYIDLSELPAGSYTASVRLLFRTFPMYFLRELEVEATWILRSRPACQPTRWRRPISSSPSQTRRGHPMSPRDPPRPE